MAAFQTRNPMHRSHEYLAKVAIEVCDGVLVHSLLGHCKPGDIPADVRTKAIARLVEKYFRPGTVVQAGYPLISDLSPVSLASIGTPDFSGAGNLWNWLGQVRVTRELGTTGSGSGQVRWAIQGAVIV